MKGCSMSETPRVSTSRDHPTRVILVCQGQINESRDHNLMSPRRERCGHPSAAMDTMSRALERVAQSPFFEEIKCTKMPRHFTCLPFTCYDSKTDLVEHISHYTQLMALYSWNDGLLYKVFPSSLGPITMRWFNGLRKDSIHHFEELI